jgi:hypothetical protein
MQGPLTTIDYFDATLLVQGFGDGQATGIALRQGGNVYVHQIGTTPDFAWTPKQALDCALPSGFVRIVRRGASDVNAHSGTSPPAGRSMLRISSAPTSTSALRHQVYTTRWRINSTTGPCS